MAALDEHRHDLRSAPGESLSEVCGDLPDGFYGLPRFELPEWVWERLPRSGPQRALAELERLGPRLHLDEPTLGDKWIRFDAPGDFQLVLREDFLAIDGFDEEMLLGWHVDSNLSRRMVSTAGRSRRSTGSLATTATTPALRPCTTAAERIANDLDRFFESVVEHAKLLLNAKAGALPMRGRSKKRWRSEG